MTQLSHALLARLEAPLRALVDAVLREADARGSLVLAVGGPVRDLLLERPQRDFDLLVGAEGGGASELARVAAPRAARVTTHARFGTARIATPEAALDLATLRSERYSHPGALPSVAPGTLQDDLKRRDFTVNALAVPLSERARRELPELIDLAGGREDLARGQLRIFHSRSFHDDPTRALRAARLAARFGFRLTRGSRAALADALAEGCLDTVSGERLRREFEHLFHDPALGLDPVRALTLLERWGVVGALARGLTLPSAARVPLRRFGRAVAVPPWPLGRARPWVSGFAIWWAPCSETVRRRALERLSLHGSGAERVRLFGPRSGLWLRQLERQRGRGAIDRVAQRHPDEILIALYSYATAPLQRRLRRWAREDRGRKLALTGRDLEALGLHGPAVGEALAELRVATLDGKLRNRDEALAFAREWSHQKARRSERTAGSRRRR